MTSGSPTPRKLQGADDTEPEDHFDDETAPVVGYSGTAGEASEVLGDAAVADLLESVPTCAPAAAPPPLTEADVDGGSERNRFATTGSLLFTIVTSSTLVVSTTIAFAVVATRAPAIASILLGAYLVLVPIAVVAVLREEASRHPKAAIPDARSDASES